MKKIKSVLIIFSFLIPFSGNCQWLFMGFGDEAIHAIAVHPGNPDIIFAAGNELYKTSDGGLNWDTVANYPFNSISFHPLGPDTLYATFGLGTFSDGIYKSIDGGDTWNVLNWMLFASSVNIPSYPPGMILAGSSLNGIQLSYDYGITWQSMNDSLTNLHVLSVANFLWAGGGPVFLAGTKGGIFRHTIGYWEHMNSTINIHVPAISIFSETSPLCWAAFDGGSNSDGMYKSTDYGDTWAVSEYWDFITDILINPLDSQIVFAADSGMGVKVTFDGGISWMPMNNNLTDSVVYCLAQSISDTSTLYAGTDGGLFKYDLSTGINGRNPEGTFQFSVFPNPASNYINLTIEDLSKRIFKIQIIDSKGQNLYTQQFNGLTKVILHRIDVSEFCEGVYYISLINSYSVYTQKFIVF